MDSPGTGLILQDSLFLAHIAAGVHIDRQFSLNEIQCSRLCRRAAPVLFRTKRDERQGKSSNCVSCISEPWIVNGFIISPPPRHCACASGFGTAPTEAHPEMRRVRAPAVAREGRIAMPDLNPRIFETIMLVCFGCSWPFAIAKTIHTKTVKGKSIVIIFLIFVGYMAGIIFKLIGRLDGVILLYITNGT
jgi:hypothetical protein